MKKHKKTARISALVLFLLLILMMLVSSCHTGDGTSPKSSGALPSDGAASETLPYQEAPAASGADKIAQTDPATVAALAQAKETNPDTAAWLCVTGTDIDNPVMQTANNSDYLVLGEDGKYDGWGAYFADYYANLAAPDSLIENTVIYGHAENPENPDGKKFSQLFRYADIDFMRENPYLYLTVGEETLAFEIFAVFYTGIDFYYINPAPSAEGFGAFLDTVQAKNEYRFPDITVTEGDKLLTLSTCSHLYDTDNTRNHRFVVMAKLVDSVSDAAPNVVANPSPVRP